MRADAERQLRQRGLWSGGTLPLAAYTLARYASSEVGSGSPEEKVAVMEAALHRAGGTGTTMGWYPDGDVNRLLLYRQSPNHPNYGWYGPIHAAGGTSPYGRWAATSQDPGIDDLLIADFVLKGNSENFSRGAVTQYGPEVRTASHPLGWAKRGVRKRAEKEGLYWVGPLPGVDHWRTFLYAQDKSIDARSPLGADLINRGEEALSEPMRRPDWSRLPVCPRPHHIPGPAVALLSLFGGLSIAYIVAAWVEPVWRASKAHSLNTDPHLWERFNRMDPWNS